VAVIRIAAITAWGIATLRTQAASYSQTHKGQEDESSHFDCASQEQSVSAKLKKIETLRTNPLQLSIIIKCVREDVEI